MSHAPESVAFQRVIVDFKTLGGARVTWTHARHFMAPPPWLYQLQWGLTGNDTADDWADTGLPQENVFYLIDTGARFQGKVLAVHYRIKLMTGDGGIYYSSAATSEGGLSKKEWLFVREMIRRESLLNKKYPGVEGFLLTAKRHGPQCDLCLDPNTKEAKRSRCPRCLGTRFLGGYYAPLPGQYSQLEQTPSREHRDMEKNRGPTYDEVPRGRFIGYPQLHAYDAWVDKDSDQRYYFHEIGVKGHCRGVPVVYDAELRLAPPGDIIYTVAL
jgi:hypothetical protein